MSKDTQFEGQRFFISAAPCSQPVDCKQTGLVIGEDMEHGQWVRSSDYDRLAAALQSAKDEAERARGVLRRIADADILADSICNLREMARKTIPNYKP